ncbi:MAG: hypothetical protein ACRDDZ_06330 [Marinifilaceae bacterium]
MIKMQSRSNYKRFYSLLGKMPGVRDRESAKVELVNTFTGGRTESLTEMTHEEYARMCHVMNDSIRRDKGKGVMDVWRKRTIASIFGYFKLIEKEVTLDYVKAVATRAGSKANDFNELNLTELRTIYNEFLRQQEIIKRLGRDEALLQQDKTILKMCGIDVKVSVTKTCGDS